LSTGVHFLAGLKKNTKAAVLVLDNLGLLLASFGSPILVGARNATKFCHCQNSLALLLGLTIPWFGLRTEEVPFLTLPGQLFYFLGQKLTA